MNTRTKMVILLMAAMMVTAGAAGAATQYAIIDLGDLGGIESKALDISPTGEIVGYASLASGDYHAFLWNGAMQDLGVIFGANQKMAFAISPSNQVFEIGYNYGDLTSQAFSWIAGSPTASLGSFSARAVNASDSVVGCLTSANTTTVSRVEHACLWQNGTLTDLGTAGGGFSYANDINNLGDIVGASLLADQTTMHACIWRNWNVLDLGTLGGINSQAYAINDAGRIVGWADTPGGGAPHGFVFATDQGGNVTSRIDIGTLNGSWSYAYGVNNLNQVVGTSGRAFLWQGGVLTDLNSLLAPGSGWKLASAHAITDAGQIAGYGQNPQGFPHGFVMFPVLASVADAKALADGASTGLQSMIVTATFDGFFYAENVSRTMGIRVAKANHALSVGQTVTISGKAGTNLDGERYIDATVAAPVGLGTVAPLGMPGKLLGGGDWIAPGGTAVAQRGVSGGFGLNNIGLLIRTTGRVTFVGADFIYVDDGSSLDDGSGNAGVKVWAPGLALPTVGQMVSVTGVSSCFANAGSTHRQILARSPDGILVLQ